MTLSATGMTFALPRHHFGGGDLRVGSHWQYHVGDHHVGMVTVIEIGPRLVTVRMIPTWEFEVE